MPLWLLLVGGGGLAVFLLRRGQDACALPPMGAQRGPASKLQQDRVLGPPPGDLSAPGFAPTSQNPPVTTVIHSLIVSGVRGSHNRVTEANDIVGARYTYGDPRPTLLAAPGQGDATDDVDYKPPYRSQLPFVIEPSMLPGSPGVQQTRVMGRGLVVPPAAPPPNTVVFSDIVGPVGVRKKLGSY
jgi:hypothetical protein